MSTLPPILTNELGSLFIQLSPDEVPEYFGCVDLDDIVEPGGDQTLLYCRDANGNFQTVGSTQGIPGSVTFGFTAPFTAESDILDRIRNCPITLYVMTRQCGRRDVFSNYLRATIIHHARITARTYSNLVKRGDAGEITRKLDGVAWNPLYVPRELTVARQTVAETRDLNDIVFCNAESCGGVCGIAEAPGTDGFVVSDGNAGTPYLNGDVWLTTDGGGTWANATGAGTHPFTTIENLMSSVCFGVGRNATRILVARAARAAEHARVSYSDDDGATWNEVEVGSVDNEGAVSQGALFALDWQHVWFATGAGNIYFSADGGVSWDLQTTGVVTSLNVVEFADIDNGWAGGDSDTLLQTTDGGTTWAAVTPPTTSDNITALHVWSRDQIMIGSNAGELWQTLNAGTTWGTQKTYTGQVATDTVKAIDFANDQVGFMLVNTNAPVGYVHKTIDNGNTWERLTTPTNTGLNALAVIDENLAFAVGNAQGGTAVILKISG